MSEWSATPAVRALVEVLGGDDTTRAVGGAVRDGLLGRPVSDVDLATRLLPEEVIARASAAGFKPVPTGLQHGTVTVVARGEPVEVTTLRRDVATDGRHAEVAFTDDWVQDASRRDFTMNALYRALGDGTLHDYFDGLADLAAGRVRFIGDPLRRIAEDHLRILRFFRFHARFGQGPPDADGLRACAARANDLMALSRERIASELLKLLGSEAPLATVATIIEHGVLRAVLPEFDGASVARLEALIAAEAAAEVPGSAVRRLAALTGSASALAKDLVGRLRLSNADGKRLMQACAPGVDGAVAPLVYRLGADGAADRLLLDGDSAGARRALATVRPVFPLKGADLVARGLAPGPEVGRLLRDLEQQWIDAGFPQGKSFASFMERVKGIEPSS